MVRAELSGQIKNGEICVIVAKYISKKICRPPLGNGDIKKYISDSKYFFFYFEIKKYTDKYNRLYSYT